METTKPEHISLIRIMMSKKSGRGRYLSARLVSKKQNSYVYEIGRMNKLGEKPPYIVKIAEGTDTISAEIQDNV
jgi:hypothetical protein